VKSVTLDAWTDEQIESISGIGNAKAKEIYECTVPKNYPRPDETSDNYTVEQWIRAKYEHKEFMGSSDDSNHKNNKVVPDNNNINESKITASSPSAAPKRQANTPRNHSSSPSSKITTNTKTATNNMDADPLITLEEPAVAVNGFPYSMQNNPQQGGSAAGREYFPDNSSTTPRLTKEAIMELYKKPPAPTQVYSQATTIQNYYPSYVPQTVGYPQYQYPVYPPATTFTPGVGYTVAGVTYSSYVAPNGQWKPN